MFGEKNSDKDAWFEEAKRAYEEFCAKRAQQGKALGTFSELEAQAVEAGDRLARFLIENRIAVQSTESPAAEECECPHCGRPARRKDEEPEGREIRAKPGAVGLERQGYYCVPCRKVFFSGGPRTGSEG
ncbi:MAG: hypothetical protein L0191_15005 [Acidobacteria bacterium]|nr:hypothetical protein [Acidobacteriota bacterium]